MMAMTEKMMATQSILVSFSTLFKNLEDAFEQEETCYARLS